MAKRTFQTSVIAKEICPPSQTVRIKLCGYLRKKRNKMGGWRKLWFVLQDRLLVSYTSKEEYDNKLVSFKDVLNLMPGTQIRPMEGFRFTIETTTQMIYTFHCDDHTAYREWIATLMDSAGSTLNCSRRFQYFSHDPIMNDGIQTKLKHCDLLTGAEHNVLQNYSYTANKAKEIVNRNVGSKPWPNLVRSESQTLKRQIERMSISGNEEYRLLAFTPCVEKHSRSKLITTQNTEHSLVQKTKVSNESLQNQETAAEPIYAVVDLQNKYNQRKKRSALLEEKRSNSYESICRLEKNKEVRKSLESLIDTVYEDGDLFFNQGILESALDVSKDTEENIYEPINVEQKASMFELRKYIARFKLNPFLRTATTRKLKSHCVDSRLPSSNSAMSRFSTLRWKLGKHRKSMQRRMRKLYSSEYEPNPLFQYHTEEHATNCKKDVETSKTDVANEITRMPNGTKEHSDEDTLKTQTEASIQRSKNLKPLKKVVAKIPLFNMSAVKNAHQ